MLTTGVGQVGLPDAVADLVDVTLNSPNYVYRDEVLTDASAVAAAGAAAADDELHAGRRAARDGRPVVGGAGRQPRHRRRRGGDRRQAARDARGAREADAVLHLVAGGAASPTEFTIAPTVFPEFTPALAAAMVDETKAFLNAQLSQGGAHAQGRHPVDAVVRLGRAGVDLRRRRVGRDHADGAGPDAAARASSRCPA